MKSSSGTVDTFLSGPSCERNYFIIENIIPHLSGPSITAASGAREERRGLCEKQARWFHIPLDIQLIHQEYGIIK
jgi:hypothetical protein